MHDTIYPMLTSSLGGLHNNPDRELPERTGNRHSDMAIAPYNIYDRATAGWPSFDLRAALTRVAPHSAARPDRRPPFRERRTGSPTSTPRDEVSACTRTRTRAELMRGLEPAGVSSAPVKSIREVDTDEHLIQRGIIRTSSTRHGPRSGAGMPLGSAIHR